MAFDYEKLRKETTWDVSKKELGYKEGEPINIGYLCTDRNVELGRGKKLALLHENHEGNLKKYTYQDLSELTNAWGEQGL